MTHDIFEMMKSCALIEPLMNDFLPEVQDMSKVIHVPESEFVFRQGDTLSYIYLLCSGSIKLQRLAQNGQEKVLEIVSPGQTFAEALIFSRASQYPVSAIALMDSVLVCINAQIYLKLLKTSNELCLTMMGVLSRRLHWMVHEVDRLTLHNATYRLVNYLVNQAENASPGAIDLQLSAPKNVIASRLSIKPETFSRTLRNLAQMGLIKLDRGQIEIINLEQLKQFISEEE